MKITQRRWTCRWKPLSIVCAATVMWSALAAAQDVTVTRGYIWMYTPQLLGVNLGGSRGFTFHGLPPFSSDSELQMLAQPDVFGAAMCDYTTQGCAPGTVVDLSAQWIGSRLTGHATLDGAIRPRVGDIDVLSITLAGAVTLPPRDVDLCAIPDGGCGFVTAPFNVSGIFSADAEQVGLSGNGAAKVYLSTGADGTSWVVARIDYELEPALPEPWISRCPFGDPPVGPAYCDTHATVTDGSSVVSGNQDFWGSYDGGHYISRHLDGDGEIVARVRAQSSTDPYAKAGVMMRECCYPWYPHVLLDLKPDGGIEFMARRGLMPEGFPGLDVEYLSGAVAPVQEPWLKLVRTGDLFTGWVSADAVAWTEVGEVTLSMRPAVLASLGVSSHSLEWNTAIFDRVRQVPAPNLLIDGGFETGYLSKWVSDDPYRQTAAIVESFQPRTGTYNGACWTPAHLDCGIHTEVQAYRSGTYTLTFHATADRDGGLVGANVNGTPATSAAVEPRGWRNYGEPYVMTFTAQAGDTIRVWMYSPAAPGYVVIDDVSLTSEE